MTLLNEIDVAAVQHATQVCAHRRCSRVRREREPAERTLPSRDRAQHGCCIRAHGVHVTCDALEMRGLIVAGFVSLAACAHDAGPCAGTHTAPQRCTLPFAGGQLLVDGEPSTSARAAAYCGRLGDALVYLDDHSQDAAWRALETELRAKHVHIYVSGRVCGHPKCGREPRIVPSRPVDLSRDFAPLVKGR